ncbi:MAG: DUF2007 domain-containing protein [Thiobacillus sp.]
MKRVLIAPTLLDAQLAVDALSSLGIVTHIFNANAAGALGEVPFMQAQPEVWVDDDAQEARAGHWPACATHRRATEKPAPIAVSSIPGIF